MSYGIKFDVKGEYALFTRTEFKVERVSYDVITPSAARGIIEAVYFKPAIKYVIDKIHVYNEPEFTNIRRNEVDSKILCTDMQKIMNGSSNAKDFISTKDCIQQRAAIVLKNVHYAIECHFVMTGVKSENDDECPKKHYNVIKRRLENGQCFHQPCLGCREFPADVSIVEGEVPTSTLTGKRDLGYMLYDMEYKHGVDYKDVTEITPLFYRAVMNNGIIDLSDVRIVR